MKNSTIIAVANQKGGVGKTTTVLNIGAGLSKKGKTVLLVDLDPQNHLSRYCGYSADGRPTISELIHQEVSRIEPDGIEKFIRTNTSEKLDYIPSNNMLAGMLGILGMDSDSAGVIGRILRKDYFAQLYDYILIDCQPSLDLLVTNALKCCDKLLIPVQAELWSYEGVEQMLGMYRKVKGGDIRPYLLGMLVTMYRKNTTMSKSVFKTLKESYGDYVCDTPISFRAEVSTSTVTRNCPVNKTSSVVGNEYMQIVNWILGGME